MTGGKRSFDDAEASSSKLSKSASSMDVAASKSKKQKTSRANVPPKGQDVDGNAYWELSRMRRVGISHFKNTVLINIREYYESAGQMRPGKKGISLSLDQYKALVRAIPDINATLRADNVVISEAEDDAAANATADAPKEKGKKPKVPKKANIDATSSEDSE